MPPCPGRSRKRRGRARGPGGARPAGPGRRGWSRALERMEEDVGQRRIRDEGPLAQRGRRGAEGLGLRRQVRPVSEHGVVRERHFAEVLGPAHVDLDVVGVEPGNERERSVPQRARRHQGAQRGAHARGEGGLPGQGDSGQECRPQGERAQARDQEEERKRGQVRAHEHARRRGQGRERGRRPPRADQYREAEDGERRRGQPGASARGKDEAGGGELDVVLRPGTLGDDDLGPRRARHVERDCRAHARQHPHAQVQRSLTGGDGEGDLRAGRRGADPESIEPRRRRIESPDIGIEVRADRLGPARAQEVARRRARFETHEPGGTRRRVHGHGGEEGHDEGAGAARRDHRASARRVAGGAASPPTADGGTR